MQVWMKKLYQVAQQPVGTPAYFLKVGRAVHFAAIDLFCLVRFQSRIPLVFGQQLPAVEISIIAQYPEIALPEFIQDCFKWH